jgi:glycerol-3-phosphate dehydrogenase (NAD(P)+)
LCKDKNKLVLWKFTEARQLVDTIKVAVLGQGAWGQALAKLVAANGHRVCPWSYRQGASLQACLADCDLAISAISMKGVVELATQLQAIALPERMILVTATKGLDLLTTYTPSQIFQAKLPCHQPIAVLSGPNLSLEIEQGLPAATVVASANLAVATQVQQVIASDSFRVYTCLDPLGAELGGTLKNVVAIAVGVCDGLNLGFNARAALITRALPEVIRIGTRLGAQVETFFGLSGLGDMLATCTSPLSRNYRVGYGLAQGKPLTTILAELGGTAEGVNTAHVVMAIAEREHLAAPIATQVHNLLQGTITPQAAVEALMERDLKTESGLA